MTVNKKEKKKYQKNCKKPTKNKEKSEIVILPYVIFKRKIYTIIRK